MATGTAAQVVERLHEMKERAQVDEVVVVTPSLDRQRRIGSYREIARAWGESS